MLQYTFNTKLAMTPFSLSALRQSLVPPSREGWILGYSGLAPFVFLCLLSWLANGSMRVSLLFALVAYGATILSFLGAIHWGLALQDAAAPPARMLVWGVMPSLLAWGALMAGATTGLWLVAIGLWICFAVDRSVYPRFGLGHWLGMRLTLTTIASLTCIVAASA